MQRLYTFLKNINMLFNFNYLYDSLPNFKIHFNPLYGHMTEIIGIKTKFLFYAGIPGVSRQEVDSASYFGLRSIEL